MRVNNKLSERYELSLDGRQAAAIVAASLVIVAGAFVLGMSYGTRAALAAPTAPKDSLARLDEPLTAAPKEDEALRAHEALTAAHPEALPAPAVKPVAAPLAQGRPESGEAKPKGETEVAVATASAALSPPSVEREVDGGSIAIASSPSNTAATSNTASPVTSIDLPSRHALPSRTAKPDHKSKQDRASAARHGGYTIQVASVAHRAEAEKVAKRFARRSSHIVAADVPGKGRVWRVQVGSYPTRDAASRGLAAIGGAGFVTAAR